MFIWGLDWIVDSPGTGTEGLQVRNNYRRVIEESPGLRNKSHAGAEAEPASAPGFGRVQSGEIGGWERCHRTQCHIYFEDKNKNKIFPNSEMKCLS